MSIVVTEVSIPSEAFELGSVLRGNDQMRIELTQFVPTGDGLAPYFWAEMADHDAFERTVRGDDRVADLTEVDAGPDKRLYHVEWTDPSEMNGFLEAIRTHDLIAESAVGTRDTWRFRLRARDHDCLAAFQETCAENGIPTTVHRVWDPTAAGDDPSGLTVDQREALRVAADLGYFETPSKATLDEVGEKLGISPQAASKRIRGGVEKLVAAALLSGG